MKSADSRTLSRVPTTKPATHITVPALHCLVFLHRFRHATPRHVQLALAHVSAGTTFKLLSRACAKGYVDRQYGPQERRRKAAASYYLTSAGLSLLQSCYPERTFRSLRSVRRDATLSRPQCERYHTLAAVYAHFKRHHDGQFEFFSSFDLAGLDFIPEQVPDGYIRTSIPGNGTQHHFIEIYGWGRSTQTQAKRLRSYIEFASTDDWQAVTGEPLPGLYIVTASPAAQTRLHAQLKAQLAESMANDVHIAITVASNLDSNKKAIWRQVV